MRAEGDISKANELGGEVEELTVLKAVLEAVLDATLLMGIGIKVTGISGALDACFLRDPSPLSITGV